MATQTATVWPAAVGDDYFELVRRFPLVPIRTDGQLDAAHVMIDELSIIDEDQLTPGQAGYLDVLCELTEAYEGHLVDDLTAEVSGRDILQHMADEHELTAEDVGRLVGEPAAGAALLDGTRPITADHALAFAERFHLPADLFLKQSRA